VALLKVIEGLHIHPGWLAGLMALGLNFIVYFIIMRDLSQVIGGRPKESRFQKFATVMGPILMIQFLTGYGLLALGANGAIVRLAPDLLLILMLAVFGHWLCPIIVREPERAEFPSVVRGASSFVKMIGLWVLGVIVLTVLAYLVDQCAQLMVGIPGSLEVLRGLWSIFITAAGYFISALFATVIWTAWIKDHPEDDRALAEI
ncbi:MAG: hypothetical protein AAGJ92_09160, partial [Pseudomonadota bacterium]